MHRAIAVLVASALAVASAGCIGAGKFQDLYADAEFRWTGSFSDGLDDKRCHDVPHGKRLDVMMRYEMSGQGEVRLHMQDGPVRDFPIRGTADVAEEPWRTFDPVFGGEWCFEVDVNGDGDYAFAFEVE